MKFLNFDDWWNQMYSIGQDVAALDFCIPEHIFSVMTTLTNVVGYIMPLRLYLPIIMLILGYWFILILSSAFKFAFSLLGGISSFSHFIK